MTVLKLYLFLAVPMSLIGFGAMGYDKRQSRNGGWRLSERTLHGIELAGGWPGSWAGQRYFRHKTSKMSYQVLFWLIVVAHGSFLFWGLSPPNQNAGF